MSKLFNFYSDNIDKTWYKSSNVKYTECIDNENKPKTLKVVFNSGTQYQYNDVDVRDYLLLRESESQGKALNRIIKGKKYAYEKLQDADLDVIDEEYLFRTGNGYTIKNGDTFEILDNHDNVTYKLDKSIDEDTLSMIQDILKSLGIITRKI